jgi:hypothetical protein
MTETGKYSIEEAHRFFAVNFNTAVWRLSAKENQSEKDQNEMINLAHASLLHWSKSANCKMQNLQRGEYLIAMAYINAGREEPAMVHAKRCVEITDAFETEMQDFDLAHSRLIMGIALRLQGNTVEAEKELEEARRLGEKIKNEKDKEIFMLDFSQLCLKY